MSRLAETVPAAAPAAGTAPEPRFTTERALALLVGGSFVFLALMRRQFAEFIPK